MMEDKVFKVDFIDRKVHAWHRNFKYYFTLGFRVDGIYQVGGSTLGALASDTSIQCEIWHRRFSHLHYKALHSVRKIVTGMSKFHMNHEGVYQGCASRKHTKGPFPSSERKTINILQLIHYDMFVSLTITSLGGYSYYEIFLDDLPGKTCIYFLKRKDEVFKWFHSLKSLVENKIK